MTWVVTGAGGQLGSHLFRVLCDAVGKQDGKVGSVVGLVSRREQLKDSSLPLAFLRRVRETEEGSRTAAQEGGILSTQGGAISLVPVDLEGTPAASAPMANSEGDGKLLGEKGNSFEELKQVIRRLRPTVVIHCAAISVVSEAVKNPNRARQVNVLAPLALAEVCTELQTLLVYVSTDMVFNGEDNPDGGYLESTVPRPLSVYGRSKRDGEHAVLHLADPARSAAEPDPSNVSYPVWSEADFGSPGYAVVVRVPLMLGVADSTKILCNPSAAFFKQQYDSILSGNPVVGFHDEFRTPLSYIEVAQELVRLCHILRGKSVGVQGTAQPQPIEGKFRVIHLGGPLRKSRCEIIEEMDRFRQRKTGSAVPALNLVPKSRNDFPGEPRARDLSLSSTLAHLLGVSFVHSIAPTAASQSNASSKEALQHVFQSEVDAAVTHLLQVQQEMALLELLQTKDS
jgi:hypothetical protein